MRPWIWLRSFLFAGALFLCSCGTINSHVAKPIDPSGGRTAYIVENDCSEHIQNMYILSIPTVGVVDGPTYQQEKRGDTEVHIRRALERHGFQAQIGPEGALPEGTAVLVKYRDLWKWDAAWYLQYLRISFVAPRTGEELAFGEFNNGRLHSFQMPRGEVPRIIDSIFQIRSSQ